MENKKSNIKKTLVLIFLLAILATTLFSVINLKKHLMTLEAVREQEKEEAYRGWLVENCECLENERIFCSEGFELKGNACRNETRKVFTNVLRGCSKYNCSEEIIVWSNVAGIWEK